MGQQSGKLIIACGALAREIQQLIEINCWTGVDVQCLPADLHNRPDQIPHRVLDKIQSNHESICTHICGICRVVGQGSIRTVCSNRSGWRD